MGENLLLYATLGLCVEVFDYKYSFADLIEFLDSPPSVVDVFDILQRIALGLFSQCRTQTEHTVGNFVFDKPEFPWNDFDVGMFPLEVHHRTLGRIDGDYRIGLRT